MVWLSVLMRVEFFRAGISPILELVGNAPSYSTDNPMFSEVEKPSNGKTLAPTTPLNFQKGEQPAKRGPLLGEHIESVLFDVLKFDSKGVSAPIDCHVVTVI